jgi:TRAP-type C4-dicarboxylate transport system substrate-binding protein
MSAAPAVLTVVSIFVEGSETMDGMKNRSGLAAALVLAMTMAFAATACADGGGGGGGDKAGGTGPPVVLRLASTGSSIDQTPAVEYFVKRVEELSERNVRIEVVDEWAEFASDAEQQVVRDVASGEADLGWVGTRIFDTLGVKSFQALTAPMLIDSYALQNAVIESGITDEMIQGLDDLGVVGLGVLPDGLRKPIGVTAPILGSADWQGITFGTLMSNSQAEAIRALGATPAQIFGPERREALEKGTIQGFEFSMWLYKSKPEWPRLAPYVAANVNLWPQMDVLLANPAGFAALSGEQRGWLEEAARVAAGRSTALADMEADAVDDSCRLGARFAKASTADLAALEAAFAPTHANLEQHPETKAFIERIQELKESTHAEPVLAISAECTGTAPGQATGGTGNPPARLNGTYRFVLTQADEDELLGGYDPPYPRTNTWILKNGHFEVTVDTGGGSTGSYSVDGNRITFEHVGSDYTTTFTFTVDDEGNLSLDPVPPMDPGDAFENGAHTVWTKID